MPIPNEYTGCETYRGFTIAIRNGSYYLFDHTDKLLPGHFGSRAHARQQADFHNASSLEEIG